jgi:membrane-bound serine protease (ClpP class)
MKVARKIFKSIFITCFIIVSCVIYSWASVPEKPAAVIRVQGPFSAERLRAVERQIERVQEDGALVIVFNFSDQGRSFESYSQLARTIRRASDSADVETVAFIPEKALGMTMLAVLACDTIVADGYAEIGRVLPLVKGEEDGVTAVSVARVVNKIRGFAEAAGHDPLVAEAMVDKNVILYEIERKGRRQLVDQAGFERLTQRRKGAWKMVGSRPVVGGDETLLVGGRRAKDLGLVSELAENRDDLAEVLSLNWVESAAVLQEEEPNDVEESFEQVLFDPNQEHKAVVIVCAEMVDDGMYQSIKRRTEAAIADGATYIIYRIDTFGGALHSAISIWDYFMHEVSPRAHTVAYIPTKAISAGALISVACNDIIMKKSTQIGDCAPIIMGGKLEGVEREKAESPTRSYFEAAAEKNGYPVALCKAMVTINLKVYRVRNLGTGKDEYFEEDELPSDPFRYDLESKKLVVKGDQLLTWHADKAVKHGLARVVVDDLEGAVAFLEKRDGVSFDRPLATVETNWSEEMVRWLNSPAIAGILMLVGMLGIYAELNSPGLGLPGAIGVTAFVILFGSKYMIGLANWWEILVFLIGIGLLTIEVFVLPGFGVPGIVGVFLIFFSFIAMMVANEPGQMPIPQAPMDWDLLERNFYSLLMALGGFFIGAFFITRYIPSIPLINRMVLNGPVAEGGSQTILSDRPEETLAVSVGDEGETTTQLRPCGRVKFGCGHFDVISRGQFVEPEKSVVVVEIEGNSIVVKGIA